MNDLYSNICTDLPDGWMLSIHFENNRTQIQLLDPNDDDYYHEFFDDETLPFQQRIEFAVSFAKGKHIEKILKK